MVKRLLAGLFLALATFCAPAQAQQVFIVATCGTVPAASMTLTAGNQGPLFIDTTGALCTNATGGGGGGAVTVADGADVTQGAKADAACGTDTGTCTEIALIKRQLQSLTTALASLAAIQSSTATTATNTGAAIPAGTARIGYVSDDPCQQIAKTYTPISITTNTTTRIVAPTAAKRTYVCYMYLQNAAADNIAVVEGTGGTCGSGTAGVVGGTTAANGLNNAANSGQGMGNGGFTVFATAGTNVDLCLITSAATPLAGTIAWVQAP